MGLISGTWRGGNLLANDGGPGPKKPPNPNRGGNGLGRGGRGRGGNGAVVEFTTIFYADFTGADQTYSDAQILNTPAEGMVTGTAKVYDPGDGSVSIASNAGEFVSHTTTSMNTGIIGQDDVARVGPNTALFYKIKDSSVAASKGGVVSFTSNKGDPASTWHGLGTRPGSASGDLDHGGTNTQFAKVSTRTADTYREYCLRLGGFNTSIELYSEGKTAADYNGGGALYEKISGTWNLIAHYDHSWTTPLYPVITTYLSNPATTTTVEYARVVTSDAILDAANPTTIEYNPVDTFMDPDPGKDFFMSIGSESGASTQYYWYRCSQTTAQADCWFIVHRSGGITDIYYRIGGTNYAQATGIMSWFGPGNTDLHCDGANMSITSGYDGCEWFGTDTIHNDSDHTRFLLQSNGSCYHLATFPRTSAKYEVFNEFIPS